MITMIAGKHSALTVKMQTFQYLENMVKIEYMWNLEVLYSLW